MCLITLHRSTKLNPQAVVVLVVVLFFFRDTLVLCVNLHFSNSFLVCVYGSTHIHRTGLTAIFYFFCPINLTRNR